MPDAVRRFAGRLSGLKGKYVFAVCNYGGGFGDSLSTLAKILRENGETLSAAYGVHMPQNAFHKPWEKYDRIYAVCTRKLDRIAAITGARRRGFFLGNIVWNAFMLPLHLMFRPVYPKGLCKYSDSPEGTPMSELVCRSDMSYSVGDACTGCGICARVCPMRNIEIRNDRPIWLHCCEACLACYNWCPEHAIRGGIAHEGYYYRNSRIKLSDITASTPGGR